MAIVILSGRHNPDQRQALPNSLDCFSELQKMMITIMIWRINPTKFDGVANYGNNKQRKMIKLNIGTFEILSISLPFPLLIPRKSAKAGEN